MDIDEDVLGAAKELAARANKTAGQIISELARSGIHGRAGSKARRKIVNGFEVMPAAERVVTPQLVQKILDESGEA